MTGTSFRLSISQREMAGWLMSRACIASPFLRFYNFLEMELAGNFDNFRYTCRRIATMNNNLV